MTQTWEPDLSFTGCQNPAAGQGCASAQAVHVKVWMQVVLLKQQSFPNGWCQTQRRLGCLWLKEVLRKAGVCSGLPLFPAEHHQLGPSERRALPDWCLYQQWGETWKVPTYAGYQKNCSGCSVCPEEPSKPKDDTRNFLRALFFFVQSRNLPNFSDAYRNNQLLHSMTNVVYV